jgi:hypothetical protein
VGVQRMSGSYIFEIFGAQDSTTAKPDISGGLEKMQPFRRVVDPIP